MAFELTVDQQRAEVVKALGILPSQGALSAVQLAGGLLPDYAAQIIARVPGLVLTYNDVTGLLYANKTPTEIFDVFSTARSAPGIVRYVDGAAGSDSNNGQTSQTPYKSMWKVKQEAAGLGATYLGYVKGGAFHYNRNYGFSGPAGSIDQSTDGVFIATDGIVDVSNADALTFAADSTYPGCYVSVENVANAPSEIFDWINVDAYGCPLLIPLVATVEIYRATPNSAFYDVSGTKIYIHRIDNAAPTNGNTRVCRNVNNFGLVGSNVSTGLLKATSDDGWLVTGSRTDRAAVAVAPLSGLAVPAALKAYVFHGVRTTGGMQGVNWNNIHGLVWAEECDAQSTREDGFNGKDDAKNGRVNDAIILRCKMRNSGRLGIATSNQSFTLHSGPTCRAIANFDGHGSSGGIVRNIQGSLALLVRPKIGTDRGDVGAGGTIVPTGIRAEDAGTRIDVIAPDFIGANFYDERALNSGVIQHIGPPCKQSASASGVCSTVTSFS